MASTTPLKKAASSKKQLNPLDLFDIRSELTEDEQMVQDSVARFVDDKVLPVIRDAFEKAVRRH